MPTPNTEIPYVPEGTLDVAAGVNLALNVIDALLQTAVIAMDLTAPPGTPADGALYVPASPASGAWAGQENNLARYVEEGDFWQFYTAGVQVWLLLNRDDGSLYVFDASSSPGSWVIISGGGGGTPTPPPVVNTASANLDATAGNSGDYTRFSHAGPTYTFDDAETYDVGAEYHGRYVGAGVLTITEAGGMTVNAPAGGTLEIPPDGTFTVKIVAADEADLLGVTVPV